MKKIILLSVIAVVLFGISAGASYYLQQLNSTVARQEEHKAAHGHQTAAPAKYPPHAAPGKRDHLSPSPVVRPPFNPQAESTVHIAAQLKAREETLRQKEEALAKREKSLRLILDEMRKEQEALDAVKKEVNSLISKIEQAVRSLEKQSADMDRQKKQTAAELQQLQATITDFETDEMKRVKKLSAMYEKMEPKKAAETLRAMAEAGKLDTAAKILATMGERQAAKVLGYLPDQDVAVQLLGKVLSLKKTGPKQKE